MNFVEAILLGVVQGLGEFLPISSSGHLAITEYFLGVHEIPFLFDILLHMATLCAVVIVFRKKIGHLFCVLWRFIIRKPLTEDKADQKMILALLIGTFFTALIGFAIKDIAKEFSPFMISCCFIVAGLILVGSSTFSSSRKASEIKSPTIVQAIIVGVSQGIGVLPGISRSGSTIAASLFAGVDRKTAGEYSFLLSIFAIVGAFILELKDADTIINTIALGPLIAGMVSAFIVGYFSLKFLLGLINKGKLGWFAVYLIPLGISLAIYFAQN